MSASRVREPVRGRAAAVDRGPIGSVEVLGMRVDRTSYADATEQIIGWARQGASRCVYVATVNNVMEGRDDPSFLDVMRRGDLVTPDGMPLVWALRLLGADRPSRVVGAELTPTIMQAAADAGIPVGLYGGTPEALAGMRAWAERRYPHLQVTYAHSPPFREPTASEDQAVARDLARAGVGVLFVGLGCPKQEIWMDRMRGRSPAVMVGVGAAFDFLSGRKRRPPMLVQRLGMEWAYRLVKEPRRLWRRYLRHNPRFVASFGRQLGEHWLDPRSTQAQPSRRKDRT